ncbi:MAG: 2-succinyl-5-enolpyruvyl-6-hydroxy-3-cyclohexene-1-carboxylic-acid synthase [Bacteroidota bacterium]
MRYSDIPSAQTVVHYCESWGIKNIVISPGSRNAPLIIGFSENPFFNCFSIVDERCAAFFALGMALEQKSPTALVCTSGSALLNYYPAIAEAYYSNIPLVVISADRPPYKIDVGDGQTIRQDYIFERHIGYSANLQIDVAHATETLVLFDKKLVERSQESAQAYNEVQLNSAFQIMSSEKLPVHINVPFEEPLYGTTVTNGHAAPQLKVDRKKETSIASEQLLELLEIWNSTTKKMILVGVMPPDGIDKKHIDMLGNDPSVLVFTETTSNLHHGNFFPSIDSIVAPIEKSNETDKFFKRLQPEFLLTFGGLVVSKKIKAFLRKFKPKHHFHIDDKRVFDTFFSLSGHIAMKPNTFLNAFLSRTATVQSTYHAYWMAIKERYLSKRQEYLSQIPFSDFYAFDKVLHAIPKSYQVHLANSSTVRYSQLIDIDPSLKLFCNRGTSGIDGSTSTAIGASIHHDMPTLMLTGDLSFFYDSNALWNDYVRNDFRIIIMNNSGGGIFRILPGYQDSENFETYFETRHHLNAKSLCELYGFEYGSASNAKELSIGLQGFYLKSNRPKIFEIFTPRKVNNKILLGYFDFIS